MELSDYMISELEAELRKRGYIVVRDDAVKQLENLWKPVQRTW